MPDPGKPPPLPGSPKRAPSLPEVILDEQPEPSVLVQRRFDRPQPRKATMPGLSPVRLPGAPDEQLGQTQRAPSTTAKTIPTPAAGTKAPDAATGLAGASLPPPSQSPEAASLEAVRRRAEAAEARAQEAERQLRVQLESKGPGPYQQPVERKPSPAPVSVAPTTDQAIGKGLRLILGKLWPVFLAMAGIGGGATAVLKPTAQPEKVDATAIRVTNAERAIDAEVKRTQAIEDYARELARVNRCLRKQQSTVNGSILPAPDHFGAARKQQPWDDVCPDDPKPP